MANETDNLGRRAAIAAKWSILTQLVAKLISPVTTMVLARLLAPDAFGVVATATMVVSLADMFSDAGFQKYLIQHDFRDTEERALAACVAFWTNLTVSSAIFIGIAVFNEQLAEVVGSPGLGMVLVASALSLPLTSLVSVQTALYQRDLDFKTLFGSKVGSSLLIFAVSVSLAVIGFGYWSMVVGTIASNLFLAVWLTAKSSWRPCFAFSFEMLGDMFAYGAWVLIESALTWINTWAGAFVIGTLMNAHSVGLYMTSTSICSAVVGVFTAALLPIVFSSLSKFQADNASFERVFLKMQRYLAVCLVPVAFGTFVYRHLVTYVLLGEQWLETELFLGLWMLAGCIVVVFGYMCSEAYRAKGIPRYCALVQALYLLPFLPALWFSATAGYRAVEIVMPVTRLSLVVINLTVMRFTLGIAAAKMIYGNRWTFLQAALAMTPGVLVVSSTEFIPWHVLAAVLSAVGYIVLVFASKDTRVVVVELLTKLGCGRILPNRIREVA